MNTSHKIHSFDNEEAIIKQITDEYREGLDYVEAKRRIKYNEIGLYVEETDGKVKFKNHTIYTFMQTYLSVFYTGEMPVQWGGKGGVIKEKAQNLNDVAQFDYQEAGLSEKDFNWIWKSAFVGVGVQLYDGFDPITKTPRVVNIDPLSVIPDPYFSEFNIGGHRYFGIEMEASLSQMKNKGWENIDLVSNESFSDEGYRDYLAKYQEYGRTETSEGMFKYYLHFFERENKKYMAVLANGNRTLIHIEEIVPVFDEEKSSEHLHYPIVLRYFSPLDGAFFGISLVDLLKNDQKTVNELSNLMLIKVRKQAYGNDLFYNQNALPEGISIEQLEEPSENGKMVPMDIQPGDRIGDAFYEPQQNAQENGVYDMVDRLKRNTTESTGIDQANNGITPTNATLGGQEIAQMNANNRFMLIVKYAKWAERARWHMWRRSYVANKSLIKEKVVYLTSPTNRVFNSVFKADDFITKEMLHIRIEFKIEKKKRNMDQANFAALAPQLLATVKSESQKALVQRKQLEVMGIEEEEILRIVPYTLDELKARSLAELLANGSDDGGEIEDVLNEDHQVYIDIFRQVEQTEERDRAIEKRVMAQEYKAKILAQNGGMPQGMMNPQEQQQQQAMANIGTAQLANNAIAQQNDQKTANLSLNS